jgi:drug/metabolite transporter (DMT)-like permease
MIAAGLFFALLDTTAKYLSTEADVPLEQIIWVRFIAHGVLSVILLGPMSLPTLMRTTKPLMQWLRSGFMLSATLCNFVAVTHLRLDQTATIMFLSPLLVAGLAGPLLNEWIGWRRMLAIATGFLGIIVVMRPGFGWIHWAALFAFGATLSYSLYNIATRYVAAHDSAAVAQFYTPLAGIVLTTPLALLNWVWPVDTFTWLLLLWLGISGGFGHWLFIHALRRAPAPILAPYFYVNIIWMTSLGYLVFGDVPDFATLAGGGVIIASGLYLLYRERRSAGTT